VLTAVKLVSPVFVQGGKLPVSKPPLTTMLPTQPAGVGVGVEVAVGVDVGVGVRVAVGLGDAVAVAVGVGVGPSAGGTCGSVKASPAALMRLSNHMPRTLPTPLPLAPRPW
jgi:hypothetical protein